MTGEEGGGTASDNHARKIGRGWGGGRGRGGGSGGGRGVEQKTESEGESYFCCFLVVEVIDNLFIR